MGIRRSSVSWHFGGGERQQSAARQTTDGSAVRRRRQLGIVHRRRCGDDRQFRAVIPVAGSRRHSPGDQSAVSSVDITQ